MSILWYGGEDIDLPVRTNSLWVTTAGTFRAGYARGALAVQRFGGELGPALSAVTSAWVSFQMYNDAGGVLSGIAGAGFANSSLGSLKGIYCGYNGRKVAIIQYDGSTGWTVLDDTASELIFEDALYRFDMQVIDFGSEATINVYLDGTLALTFSGDASISGFTSFDRFAILPLYGTGQAVYYSEFIVADEDTREMSLVCHCPTADGDPMQWTGGYDAIDEGQVSNTDYSYTNTDGNQALFALSDLPDDEVEILSVRVVARAARTPGASPQSLDLGIKSGESTDVDDNHALGLTWATVARTMTVNPTTSNAFSPSEINALNLAVEAEA